VLGAAARLSGVRSTHRGLGEPAAMYPDRSLDIAEEGGGLRRAATHSSARSEGDAGPAGRGYGAKTGMDRVIHATGRGRSHDRAPERRADTAGYDAFAKADLAALSELIADDVTWHVLGVGPLSGTYHGRDEVFNFFARLAQETGGTFRLDVHDVLANDEHAVALCALSASRGNKSVEFPVANVSHIRDGQVTEFWTATTDPQASIDFWS
jgi:uncharacterized protein